MTLKSLVAQRVFDLNSVDISDVPTSKIIPSQIIFDISMNADGRASKYKARLVTQGNIRGHCVLLKY